MERPGTWGSQLELMAICQSYGVILDEMVKLGKVW